MDLPEDFLAWKKFQCWVLDHRASQLQLSEHLRWFVGSWTKIVHSDVWHVFYLLCFLIASDNVGAQKCNLWTEDTQLYRDESFAAWEFGNCKWKWNTSKKKNLSFRPGWWRWIQTSSLLCLSKSTKTPLFPGFSKLKSFFGLIHGLKLHQIKYRTGELNY